MTPEQCSTQVVLGSLLLTFIIFHTVVFTHVSHISQVNAFIVDSKQVPAGKIFKNIDKYRWHNAILVEFSGKKKFYYKAQSFTNSVTTMIQDNMKCCIYNKIRRGRVTYGKERFRMYIFYGLKISKTLKWKSLRGKWRGGILAAKILLIKFKRNLLMVPHQTSVFFGIYCERLYTIQIC